MNNAVKLEVDTSDIPNSWKIPDNHSKLNVSPQNCYLLNCNVPPMILNVENANDGIALSNLVVKGNINEQAACITRLKKIDFTDNVIDVSDVNLFTCSTVKYNPSMLLQVELNTGEAAQVPQNHLVVDSFNSSAAPENVAAPFKTEPVLSYNLPAAGVEAAEQLEPESRLKCNACDKEFTDEDTLKVHVTAHGQRTKSRRCDYCELSFPSKGKWYAHFKTHFDDPSVDCAFCSCSFVTEKYLEDHLKFHAAKSAPPLTSNAAADERTFPCTFCDKEFADRAGILFHLRIHTSDVVFRCAYCGKMFLNKSELNLHVRTHTGDKAHACDLCKKTFLTTSNLKQHLRIHTGDKPFCCTSCHKTFSNKSNLMQHIKVHTGEKPYRCKYCEKSFTTTSNLTQHLRTHTGIKPYVCDDCGKAFINKSNLSQHRKVHRSAQPKEENEKK